MDVQVNYVAVLVATLSSMVIGYFWYSPMLFGKQWMKLAKIKPDPSSMGRVMGLAVVSSALMAFVLAHMVFLANQFYGNSFFYDAVMTAFWLWLGFQFLRVLQRDQFNQRPAKETLIHIGNDFVTIMVMGIIIGLMGIK